MYLLEAVNPLHGLPKHWIQFLTAKYGVNMGGEKSTVEELTFDEETIKNTLKDNNILAIIGRKGGLPLFMIAKHEDKPTKFSIFDTSPKHGKFKSMEKGYYGYKKRETNDDYNMGEMMNVISSMVNDKDFSDVTIESITKDPERAKKIAHRSKLKNIIDPFESPGMIGYIKKPILSSKQRELIKKYAQKKIPELDKKVDNEINRLKNQIISTIDQALNKTIEEVKKGYSFSVDKKSLGEKITSQINISNLVKLAKGYSILNNIYSQEVTPGEITKQLKDLGLL